MDRLLTLLRTHPLLAGLAAATAIFAGLVVLFAILMSRAGLSLKPLVFFGVFFAIIVGPQLLFHVLRARGLAPDLTWTSSRTTTIDPPAASPTPTRARDDDAALQSYAGSFLHPEKVFGPGFDPDLLSDVRRLFASTQPEAAQMAVFRDAASTVVARFNSPATAQQALRSYAAMMGVTLPAHPADDGSFTAARTGDSIRFFVAGRTLFAWTGTDRAALDRRMTASRAAFSFSATAGTPDSTRDPRVNQWLKIMAAAVPLLVLAAALWFFKGASWAATIPAIRQSLPASPGDLRHRLLAVDSLKQPIAVTPGELTDEIVVTWRTDATTLDLARMRGTTRSHKLVLQLDAPSRSVRVSEYIARIDTSAGRGGAHLSWYKARGIQFFHYEHQRVFGLRLDEGSGQLNPVAGFAYTFDLQELKTPFIAAVTHSGWTWQPILWNAPAPLRWLVE